MSEDVCRVCGQKATHDAQWQRGEVGTGWIEHVPLCTRHASDAVAGHAPPRWLKRLQPARRRRREPEPMIPGTETL